LYKGVTESTNYSNRWVSRITINGVLEYLGTFSSQEDAARAYDKRAREFYGHFALVNLPDE
jgi:hypothetical protein